MFIQYLYKCYILNVCQKQLTQYLKYMYITQQQYSLTKSFHNKIKQYPNSVKDVIATILATSGQFLFAPINFYLFIKSTSEQRLDKAIKLDQFTRISIDRYKNCLRSFIYLLPFKDYFRSKFPFLQQVYNKQSLTRMDIFHCFIINWSCVSLVSSFRAALLFTFGRHKIEQVNLHLQEQKRRKHYQEQGKNNQYIWRQFLKARNNGFIAYLLALGVFGPLSITLFDTMTIFSTKNESKSKQFFINLSLGLLFYSCSQILCLPLLQASKTKRKQIIIKDQSKPYLFESQFYKEIWLKLFKNKESLILKSRLYPFYFIFCTKNAFILSTYHHIQKYILANSTSY